MAEKDILKDLGHLALASRLKRLADTLLADASKVHHESGEPLQPGQFPLVAALDRYGPMTVNEAANVLGISQPATTRAVAEAVKTGLVASGLSERDKRFREVSLTAQGRNSLERMKRTMWPRVAGAARALTQDLPGGFLECISEIEERLLERPMLKRVRANTLSIVPYAENLANHFHDINIEWIEAMFTIEPHDRQVLTHPQEKIIENGGEIYFVQSEADGIIGTCAIECAHDDFIELSKMGVRPSARGQGAGEFLLRYILERTREMGRQDKLCLVSNHKNVAAIALYEKLGFQHDSEIMQKFGAHPSGVVKTGCRLCLIQTCNSI